MNDDECVMSQFCNDFDLQYGCYLNMVLQVIGNNISHTVESFPYVFIFFSSRWIPLATSSDFALFEGRHQFIGHKKIPCTY